MEREMSVGGLLGETGALLGDGIRPVAIYVAVIGALNAFGGIMGWSSSGTAAQLGFMIDANRGLASALYQLFLLGATVVGGYLLTLELLKCRSRLQDSSLRILPFIGLTILTGLGVVLGFILLIVPGVILMVRWCAAPSFLIGRGKGVTESLRESWDATRGHGWAIFFAGLIMIIGVVVVAAVMGGAAGVSGSLTAVSVVSGFAEEAGTAINTAFAVAVYVLLTNDHGELGAVFT